MSENKSLIDKIKTKLIGLFDIPDGRPDSPVAIRPEEIPNLPGPPENSFPENPNDRKPGMYLSQDIYKTLLDIKAKEQMDVELKEQHFKIKDSPRLNFEDSPCSNDYQNRYMTPPDAELLSPPKEENNDLDLP